MRAEITENGLIVLRADNQAEVAVMRRRNEAGLLSAGCGLAVSGGRAHDHSWSYYIERPDGWGTLQDLSRGAEVVAMARAIERHGDPMATISELAEHLARWQP